jgi:hypothetical protein
VVEVVDVVDDVDVVEVLVVVDSAVVTGMVVLVVSAGADVAVAISIDDDVDAESVVAALSLLHAAIVNAIRIRGATRIDFTVGSLARLVAIT